MKSGVKIPLIGHVDSATVVLLAVLLAIVMVFVIYPPADWLPAAQWGELLESAGLKGMVVFLLIALLATSVGFPRQMVAFIGGVAYGVLPALLMSLVAALSGCFLTVYLSRRYLSGWVSRRYPTVVAELEKLLERDVFIKILILRLQPLGTNLLTNLCFGVTPVFNPVTVRDFMVASAVGYTPQMLIFCLLGAGVRVGSQTQLIIGVVLLLISILLGVLLFRRKNLRKIVGK